MDSMISKALRRSFYIFLVVVVGLSLVALRNAYAISAVPDELPVVLDIVLYHELWDLVDEASGESVDIVRTTDEFELEFSSWEDWRLTTLCCVDPLDDRFDPSGSIKEQRPDGTVWHRSGPEGEWVLLSDGRTEGSSPWPAFFPEWDEPTDVPDLGIQAARQLGLDPEALSARSGGGLIRTFYDPLGIPIHVFGMEDGAISVEMTVTGIRAG